MKTMIAAIAMTVGWWLQPLLAIMATEMTTVMAV